MPRCMRLPIRRNLHYEIRAGLRQVKGWLFCWLVPRCRRQTLVSQPLKIHRQPLGLFLPILCSFPYKYLQCQSLPEQYLWR